MIELVIIEDDSEIRNGLKRYLSLQKDMHCLICAESYEAFSEQVDDTTTIDVVLTDIGLPGKSGIEGIPLIKKAFPAANVLMLTVYNDTDRIFKALCAGANGYLRRGL